MIGRPNDDWNLSQLVKYVQIRLDKIQRLGRRTSVETHRLGHALSIIQQKTKPFGKWTKWLAKHNIPRQTAWEAIKLYESATEDEVAELTITDAKIKFGIYQEFMIDDDDEQTTARTREKDEDVEQQLALMHRRLKGVAETISSIEWERDLLWSVEVDEVMTFCKAVLRTVTQQRKTVPQPKREDTRPYLAYLRTI
jgi:hypothetical protein